MSDAEPDLRERLEAVQHRLAALGVTGFERVVAAESALEHAHADAEKIAAQRNIYLGLIATTRSMLEGELKRVEGHEGLDAVRAMLTDEVEALNQLAAFLEGGDKALLDSAEALFGRVSKAAHAIQAQQQAATR